MDMSMDFAEDQTVASQTADNDRLMIDGHVDERLIFAA